MTGIPLESKQFRGDDKPTSERYFGLDGVRASAMLLGVFYHLPISFMGPGFGFGMGGSPKVPIDHWLHSFRMPLFFLISGFFANLMLRKYGWKRFYLRRWWRIAAPLFVSLFVLAAIKLAIDRYAPASVPRFGLAAMMAPPPPMAAPGTAAPGGFPQDPGGPVGFGPGGPAGFVPGGRAGMTPGGTVTPGVTLPGPVPGFGGPSPTVSGAPPMPAPPMGMPPMPKMEVPSRAWSLWLFGSTAKYFYLEHLWFLWYLLVIVTVGPWLAMGIGKLAGPEGGVLDQIAAWLLRRRWLGVVAGLLSLPLLFLAKNSFGWSLANPIGFMGAFPDFLVQVYADQPFYLLYFLGGFWLYRLRSALPDLTQGWLWNLVLGIAAFVASQELSTRYAWSVARDGGEWIRWVSFALYAIGTASSGLGWLGMFQRYFDRPTASGRYLADTALWVYLVHLPLIPYLMWWVQPNSGPWWASSLAGVVLVTGVSLVLYELVVRGTPLVWIYGPSTPRRVTNAEHRA